MSLTLPQSPSCGAIHGYINTFTLSVIAGHHFDVPADYGIKLRGTPQNARWITWLKHTPTCLRALADAYLRCLSAPGPPGTDALISQGQLKYKSSHVTPLPRQYCQL